MRRNHKNTASTRERSKRERENEMGWIVGGAQFTYVYTKMW